MTNINASAHESVFIVMAAGTQEIVRNEAEILEKSPNTLPKVDFNVLVTRFELFTTYACKTDLFMPKMSSGINQKPTQSASGTTSKVL